MEQDETDRNGRSGSVLAEHVTARDREVKVGQGQGDFVDDLSIFSAATDKDCELSLRQSADGINGAAQVAGDHVAFGRAAKASPHFGCQVGGERIERSLAALTHTDGRRYAPAPGA